jgi:decaprenylphospho-beta-D-erythro-pentofuranosid-2-ulose 2-reductase
VPDDPVIQALQSKVQGQGRKFVLVLGATSAIARAAARELAERGYGLILAGRDDEEVSADAADLGLRYGVAAHAVHFDAMDWQENGETLVPRCLELAGLPPDAPPGACPLAGAVLCFGYLGDQARAQKDMDELAAIIDINYTAAAAVLERLADLFERHRAGFICAVTSVAGDRGRFSNYHYGASKAALSVFLQGLRNRLWHSGVTVTTVKPGFVDTKMIYGNKGLFLVADPDRVGRAVARAALAGKHEIYTPWFWRGIMWITRNVPEVIFKRLKM